MKTGGETMPQKVGPREQQLREMREAKIEANKREIAKAMKSKPGKKVVVQFKGKKRGRGR
jgi:hypothetical protein